MNGKKAKMLRRMAEERTPGAKARAYKRTPAGVRLAPGTTRRVYKILKTLYKSRQQERI